MALYIIPLLIILVLVLFILRKGKQNKKTGPTEEEYLAQVLKDVDQSQEEKKRAVEETEESKETAAQQPEAKPQTEPPKEQLKQLKEQQAKPPSETPAPLQPQVKQPDPKPKTAPVKKKAKQRFTPSNPLIKEYETHLNLEMLRAQNAGDEEAYLDIVRKNSVYMKNCTLLNKALADKDKGKALEALKKIREMIPKDFSPK